MASASRGSASSSSVGRARGMARISPRFVSIGECSSFDHLANPEIFTADNLRTILAPSVHALSAPMRKSEDWFLYIDPYIEEGPTAEADLMRALVSSLMIHDGGHDDFKQRVVDAYCTGRPVTKRNVGGVQYYLDGRLVKVNRRSFVDEIERDWDAIPPLSIPPPAIGQAQQRLSTGADTPSYTPNTSAPSSPVLSVRAVLDDTDSLIPGERSVSDAVHFLRNGPARIRQLEREAIGNKRKLEDTEMELSETKKMKEETEKELRLLKSQTQHDEKLIEALRVAVSLGGDSSDKLVKALRAAVRAGESSGPTCAICMDNAPDTVLLPCKHMVCCEMCALQIKHDYPRNFPECPKCRGRIEELMKVFV